MGWGGGGGAKLSKVFLYDPQTLKNEEHCTHFHSLFSCQCHFSDGQRLLKVEKWGRCLFFLRFFILFFILA